MGKIFGLFMLSACLTLQTGCSKKNTAAKTAAKRAKVAQNKAQNTQAAPSVPVPTPAPAAPDSSASNSVVTPPSSPSAPAPAPTPAASPSNTLDSLKTPPAQNLESLARNSSGQEEPAAAVATPAPKAGVETPREAWQLSDIKILMLGTLKAAQKGGLLVIADNGLRTHSRAMMDQANAGQGIMCSVQLSQDLKDGDVLTFVNAQLKPNPEDKPVTLVQVQYKSAQNQDVLFLCQARGDISEVHFKENMESIVDFRNDQGKFASDDQRSMDPRVVDAKTKTVKILNVEALNSINVHKTGEDNSKAVVEGKIVSAKEAISWVYTNRTRAACQIAAIKGELKPNVVYNRTDTEINANDETRGVAIITYTYEPEGRNKDEDFVGISCILRKSAPVHYIFNTFKGVLEFIDSGAAQ